MKETVRKLLTNTPAAPTQKLISSWRVDFLYQLIVYWCVHVVLKMKAFATPHFPTHPAHAHNQTDAYIEAKKSERPLMV